MHPHRNRNRRTILIVVALVICAIAWFVFRGGNEPMYKGKSVNAWLDEVARGRIAWTNAEAEFPKMGAMAVPYLIDRMKQHNTPLFKIEQKVYFRLPLAVHAWLPPPCNADDLRIEIPSILRAMKTDAIPAMPAMIDALSDKEEGVRMNAAISVGIIRRYLKRTDPRSCTRYDSHAVAGLIKLLADPENAVRGNAAGALTEFGPARTNAIPALVRVAASDTDYARWKAISALIGIKAITPEMRPMLEAAAKSTDENAQFQAKRALKLLDNRPPNATTVGEP